MNGGSESGGGDNYGGLPAVQVPIGWQRRVEPGNVVYVSPSGTILTSMDQLRTYLVTDGTCKCGLECPLNIFKVFNFDPRAVVKRRSAEDVKAEEDMTKLCNHRRKIVALATLYKSIESTPLALQNQAAGCGPSQNFYAASTSPKMGQHPCTLDSDIFTKLIMEKAHNTPAHHLEKPLDHKSDAFTPSPGERYSGLRSSQRPALSRQHGTPLGESYALRNCPPVPSNGSYEVFSRTPQAISHELCSSSFTQVKSSQNRPSYSSYSQELSGLSPKPLALNACSFVPGGTFSRAPDESSQGPRRPFAFPEKDPLGILDSNSCRPPSPKHHVLNSPPLIQSQVPLMNPHTAPENNPSNLSSTALPPPFPTFTRSGALTSPSTTRSSISSISSPGGSVEPSPQRSRHSSASSEHFPAHTRSSSRSPRPINSPKRSVPHSPKAILEGLPPFGQAQLGSSSNASYALIHQSNKTAPPVSLGTAQGLLGFPLGCILGQQSNASFPASNLLTAAAKAQMANQTKPEAAASSTLPSRVLNPNTLLSATVAQEGRALPSRTHSQRRDVMVKRKRQRNSPGPDVSPQDANGHLHNPTSPSGLSKLNSCVSKLSGIGSQFEEDMGRSKVLHSHSSGQNPSSLQMPRLSVEECPSQSKNPSLSPASQDIGNHLLGLVGQLVQTATEQNSGTSLPLKLPSGANSSSSSGRPNQSPVPKSPVPSLAQTSVTESNSEIPCSLPTADSFSFLGQEQVLPFSATPALLNLAMLGSLPFSLGLNQHQQLLNQGLLNLLSSSLLGSAELGLMGLQNPPLALPSNVGDPECGVLQALLMASLLHNPLLPLGGLGLPQLDLQQQNQQQSTLLSSITPLLDSLATTQTDTTEKHEAPLTLSETFPENSLQPLLFPPVSASPALMALNSALLAASLGAVDSSACPGQSCINTSSTGSASITTTTNSPALSEGKFPPSEPHSPFHLQSSQTPTSGRLNTLLPPLLNPLLTAGLLGDLSALNTNTSAQMGSLQSLLGAQALLQHQQAFLPSLPGALGMQLFQGQSFLQGPRNNTQNHSLSTSAKEVNQSSQLECCITPTCQQTSDPDFHAQKVDISSKSHTLSHPPLRPGSFNTSSAFETSPIPKGPPFQGPVRTDLPPDTPSDPPRTDTLTQSLDPSSSETEPEVSPLKRCRMLTDSVIPSEVPNGAYPNFLPWIGSPHPSNTLNLPEMQLSKGKERGYRFNGRSRGERSYGRRPRGDRLSSTRQSYWTYNGEDATQNDGEDEGHSQELTQSVLGIPPFAHHWQEEGGQPREQEVDVPPQLLKRSRRGRRRGQNSQRMRSRLEAVPAKWPSMDPANGLNAERPIVRQNRPGRPAKNRRRRMI